MRQNLNPIQKSGDRNLFCANYGECLDHAAKRHWKYWSCHDCKHKYLSQPSVHGPITTKETALFYSMPQDIYQKVI